MDIMELGAIGELVGGVAVIATLVYLAVQVRQNANLAKAAAEREVNLVFQSNIDRWAANPALFQKGLVAFDDLSHEDKFQFTNLVGPTVNHLDQTIRMQQRGLESEETLESYGLFITALVQEPGARSWWEQMKFGYLRGSREYIDARLADPERRPPPLTELIPWFGPEEA